MLPPVAHGLEPANGPAEIAGLDGQHGAIDMRAPVRREQAAHLVERKPRCTVMHEQIVAVVRNAVDPFVYGDEVRFDAACWIVRARAAASSTTPG